MKTYAGYADWVRNSNSAAKFREAFELADKMDSTIRIAVVEKLYRIANAEWEGVKEMSKSSCDVTSKTWNRELIDREPDHGQYAIALKDAS